MPEYKDPKTGKKKQLKYNKAGYAKARKLKKQGVSVGYAKKGRE